jgi:hypothetical protein
MNSEGGQPQETRKPSVETLVYAKTVLELALLLLAIPWVLIRLFRDPLKAMHDMGESHFG